MKNNEIRYSNSTIHDMRTCPAKVYWKKLEREGLIKADPVLPLVYGSGVHEGIEGAIKEGKDPFPIARKYVDDNLINSLGSFKLDYNERKKIEEAIPEQEEKMSTCLNNFMRVHLPKVREALEGHDPASCVEVHMEIPFRKGVLVGKMDLFVPGRFCVDWKTSQISAGAEKSPADRYKEVQAQYKNDTQKAIYHYIANKLGMTGLNHFKYILLQGLPTKKVQEVDEKTGQAALYKSGPRKGEPKMTWDLINGVRYDFNFEQTEEQVARIFNEQVLPYAQMYEDQIIAKNPGYKDQNCKGCRYRTVCQKEDRPLPARPDYHITEDVKEYNEDV